MKRIIIQRIRMINFKGISDMAIEFSDTETHIKGANATGKTSIFDAFTWCLFGKDSKGRKAFEIKTLDEQGKEIPKLTHEVTVSLLVDNAEVVLTKRLKEKWVKKRGEAEATFQGNEEERLYNDVPCNTKDWAAKIEAICPESTFRAITDPIYFVSMKPEAQRDMLIQLAGGITDEEIAKQSEDFTELLSMLNGKSFDEFKREVLAKKKPIKESITNIPSRIDECQRMIPEAMDFDALKTREGEINKRIGVLDEQIADKTKAYDEVLKSKEQLITQRSELRTQKTNREFEIRQNVSSEFNEHIAKRKEIKNEIATAKQELEYLNTTYKANEKRIEEADAKMIELREEWRKVNDREIKFDENDFVCPTCLRPLDVDDIEAKQKQMTELFNIKKAEELGKINQQGKDWKKLVENKETENENLRARMDAIYERIQQMESSPILKQVYEAPDAQPAIDADEELNAIISKIAEVTEKIEAMSNVSAPAVDNIKIERSDLFKELTDIHFDLQKKGEIEKANNRIAELEQQMKTQSNELAKLEGLEYTMQQFSKARIEAIEGKINAMFSFVRFKMFEQQYNGGEKEICEAMVNGVPYSALNSAMRINAGLDIINGISAKLGYLAPIFIDNAESVNSCIHTESQIVLLMVTMDKELQVLPCF